MLGKRHGVCGKDKMSSKWLEVGAAVGCCGLRDAHRAQTHAHTHAYQTATIVNKAPQFMTQ